MTYWIKKKRLTALPTELETGDEVVFANAVIDALLNSHGRVGHKRAGEQSLRKRDGRVADKEKEKRQI
jgi:hypothetical protein